MRIFIERVIYFISGAVGLFGTFLLNDTDDPSKKGDSIINMVNGSIPWDFSSVFYCDYFLWYNL